MMNKKFLLKTGFLILIVMAKTLFSQQPGTNITDPSRFQPKILPPSPEAFKLGSYGNTPVGMFTGTPNIDIPIMSFNAGDIKIPILINYSSNGIKVDEFSGKAGLGWKFIAGGVITRVIRGIPDEDGQNPGHLVNPPNLDSLKTEDGAVRKFLVEATSGGVDAEPDMYHVTFADASFSFVFDKWGKPRILSIKNIIIDGIPGGDSFTVTLENGVKYFFSMKETTTNRVMGPGHSIPSTNVTAWYLSKISDTNGTEVYLEYEGDESNGIMSKNQTMSMTLPGASYSVIGTNGNCVNGWALNPTIPASISHTQQIAGQRLIRIYSNRPKYGEIRLTYQKLFDDDGGQISEIKKIIDNINIESYSFSFVKTAPQDRAYLDNIADNKTGKKYLFEYINPLLIPQRLSFSRDKWGYFNGKTNSTLISAPDQEMITQGIVFNGGADQEIDIAKTQIGLLKKIIYPTGGHTIINYEPNTIKAKKIYKSPKLAKQLKVWSTSDQGPTDRPTETVTFYNEVAQNMYVSLRGDFNSDACDSSEDTGFHHKASISATNENGQPLFKPSGISFCPGWPDPPAGSQVGPIIRGSSVTCFVAPKGMITFNLHVAFRCTIGSSFINYYLSDIEKIENVPVGGSRVANTTTYENPLSAPTSISYKYNGEDNFSTGTLVRSPYFIDRTTSGELCIGSNTDFPLVHVSSDNLRSLNGTHPNIFYEQVIEYKNSGSIIHRYSKSVDNYGKIIQGANIISSPWTNFGWSNGRELSTSYYDSSNTLLKKVENNYEEDLRRRSVIIGLSLRKEYELNYNAETQVRKCGLYDSKIKYSDYECTANHQHTWYDGKCITAGANNILRTTYDECYGKPLGTELPHTTIVNNISIVQYKNISRFDYLKSQKTTDYLGGTPVKIETQYFYENPQHYQLTKVVQTYPDNKISETNIAYAHEKNNTKLIHANIVGVPLETTVIKKQNNNDIGRTISKTETKYDDPVHLLPTSTLSYDLQNSSVVASEVKYDKYDLKGNLLQYTAKDGASTVIIWGYNQTQPIAKIENAKLENISQSFIDNIVNASNTDATAERNNDETSLLEAFNAFKRNLPGYQITTYTYDPLIGVRSITPPSGIREVYIYDDAGRLKEVREHSKTGKLLKEFNYHYKN